MKQNRALDLGGARIHRTDAIVLAKIRKQVLGLASSSRLYAERRAKARRRPEF